MYTYKRAVVTYVTGPLGEVILDVGQIALNHWSTYFRTVKVVILDSIYDKEVTIDFLAHYSAETVGNTDTIQQWLDSKANENLITDNVLPGTVYRQCTVHDIQYEGFSLLPGNVNISDDRQDQLTSSSADDIRVHKTDNTAVDYDAMAKRCLWTINGHMVRAIPGANDLFLLNAGKHFRVYDNIHVTCLNLNTLTTLNTYPITESMIEYENHDTYSFMHLNPGIDLANKLVWMSIGGRLLMTDVVQITGNQKLALRVDHVDWFSRIFDSRHFIDLSGVIDPEREVVGADFFRTETFFKTLLTDASTFLIVLDNPHISVEAVPIETYRYPFTFHTYEKSKWPLMLSNGLLPKYFSRQIINRRLLDIDLGMNRLYINKTSGVGNGANLYHTYQGRKRPSRLNRGYFLKIQSVIQNEA